MGKSNIRTRTKREIEESIDAALAKDEEAVKKMHRILGGLARFCRDNDVEPETLLIELGMFAEMVEQKLAWKHLSIMTSGKAYPFSGSDNTALNKDFQRLLEAIEVACMVKSEEKEAERADGPPAADEAPPEPKGGGTDQAKPLHAASARERPFYIN